MPSSPFGLAYGIGAGLSGVPGAYLKGKETAQNIALKNLQMQQLQRQIQDEENTRQAMAQPIAPRMQTTETPEMTPLTPTAPEGYGAEASASEGGEETVAPKQIPTGNMVKKQEEYKYTTPWEKQAYEAQQRADKLRSMGAWKTAMKLEEEANNALKLHQSTTLQNAARAASLGNYSNASRMLTSIGLNVSKMETSPDDPAAVRVHSEQDGQSVYADIATQYIGAMIEDPAKATQLMTTLQWRKGETERKAQKDAEWAAQKEKDRISREKIAADRNKAVAMAPKGASTAHIRNVQALVESGLTPQEAWDRVLPGSSIKGSVTERDELKSLMKLNAAIRKDMGGAPRPSDPDYQDYIDREVRIKELLQRKPAPPSPKSSPSGDIAEPTSKEEYDRLPSGTKYRKDGKIYVKG